MTGESPAGHFDAFWTASELSPISRRRFAERMAGYVGSGPVVDPWSRPAAGRSAQRLAGPPADLLAGRRSDREFGPDPISEADLGRLLSVLSEAKTGRCYPSAGALYPIRAICLVFAADRRAGRVVQHDPIRHTLTEVGACPGWSDLVDDLAGQDAATPPAAVVGLYADPTATLDKYGERGGRFLVAEAGAVLQTLALGAAQLGLVGYPAGGASDRRMLGLAGLTGLPARYVLSYFVGHPAGH